MHSGNPLAGLQRPIAPFGHKASRVDHELFGLSVLRQSSMGAQNNLAAGLVQFGTMETQLLIAFLAAPVQY